MIKHSVSCSRPGIEPVTRTTAISVKIMAVMVVNAGREKLKWQISPKTLKLTPDEGHGNQEPGGFPQEENGKWLMSTFVNPLNEKCTSVLHYKELYMHTLQNTHKHTHMHASYLTGLHAQISICFIFWCFLGLCCQYGFSERCRSCSLFPTVEAVSSRAPFSHRWRDF